MGSSKFENTSLKTQDYQIFVPIDNWQTAKTYQCGADLLQHDGLRQPSGRRQVSEKAGHAWTDTTRRRVQATQIVTKLAIMHICVYPSGGNFCRHNLIIPAILVCITSHEFLIIESVEGRDMPGVASFSIMAAVGVLPLARMNAASMREEVSTQVLLGG